MVLPQRPAALVAKQAATLDVLSGGRLVLGVGAGWLRDEFDALGASFDDRGTRLNEAVAAMRAIWSQDSATFASESVTFEAVVANPKPVNGSIPIVIGGHSRAAARRAGRIGDGFHPARGSAAEVRPLIEEMRAEARRAGRDPARVEVTCGAPKDADVVRSFRDAGIDRVLLPFPARDPDEILDGLGAYKEFVEMSR